MNASEREAITFSIEVEPLVETFPDRAASEEAAEDAAAEESAALEAGALEAGALEAGALEAGALLEAPPQAASEPTIAAEIKNESIFFITVEISFVFLSFHLFRTVPILSAFCKMCPVHFVKRT